jgi:hypothetical protein
VQRFGVHVRPRQRGDRFGRQRGGREAVRDPARQRAEHQPQRVRAVELIVAVGGDHKRRQRLDPARQQPHDVERRLVGPVQILEHDDRGSAQLGRQRGREVTRRRAVRDQLGELAAHVDERAERPRRVERVARAPQHPRAVLAERAHARGLADPGLARHEHEAPAAARLDVSVAGRQQVEFRRTLQQRHSHRGSLSGTTQPRKRAAYSAAIPPKCPRRASRRICMCVNASTARRGASRSSA